MEDRHAIEEEADNNGINNTTNKVIKVLSCAHCDDIGHHAQGNWYHESDIRKGNFARNKFASKDKMPSSSYDYIITRIVMMRMHQFQTYLIDIWYIGHWFCVFKPRV